MLLPLCFCFFKSDEAFPRRTSGFTNKARDLKGINWHRTKTHCSSEITDSLINNEVHYEAVWQQLSFGWHIPEMIRPQAVGWPVSFHDIISIFAFRLWFPSKGRSRLCLWLLILYIKVRVSSNSACLLLLAETFVPVLYGMLLFFLLACSASVENCESLHNFVSNE